MMKKGKILLNQEIAKNIWKMEIELNDSKNIKMGQFIEVKVPNNYLRRPISICEVKENSIVILYKVVGEGTMDMTKMSEEIDIIAPLGNGFPESKEKKIVLVGGGIGTPPLYQVAKYHREKNIEVVVVLGFGSKEEVVLEEDFKKIGCEVYISTIDGSRGQKGNVLDIIKSKSLHEEEVYSCGPVVMLREISKICKKGYMSLEERMGCGIGACMGCVVKDKEGNSHRVCKEGPVFEVDKVVI